MLRVFDGEVVGLESSSPTLWRAKLSLDSGTARGRGNGPDHLAWPHGLTPEKSGSERSRVSTEATQRGGDGELAPGPSQPQVEFSTFPCISPFRYRYHLHLIHSTN